MVDEKKMENAKRVYRTLCDAIEKRKWKYEKKEEKLIVHFGVNSEDIPIFFILSIDADRQLIRLSSPLPFKMSESKRMEGAIAVCTASYRMADGSFDYNFSDGSIVFRMTASFKNSEIGDGLFQYMISLTCAVVDKYNEQFFAIDNGTLSIEDFIAKR